jgi:hypothetical protein
VTLRVASPPPDTTPPTTTLHLSPAADAAGWNNTSVAAGVVATDGAGGSGVAAIYYSLDSVQGSYAGTFTVSGEGVHVLDYWSADASGNVETTKAATIRIDETPPVASLVATAVHDGSADIVANATDDRSGVAYIEMELDAGPWTRENSLTTTAAGTHVVRARAYDNAGNLSAQTSAAFELFVTRATSVKLSGPASARIRKVLKFAGTISPSSAPGRVTVTRYRWIAGSWHVQGRGTVTLSKGAFSYHCTPTARGKWRFVATYSGGKAGDTTYTSSRSAYKYVTLTA